MSLAHRVRRTSSATWVAAATFLAPAGSGSPSPEATPSVAGHLVVHEGFWSQELGNRRRIWVLLPPGYADAPARRYPVLYASDGQDLFDAASAAGGEEWALDELLQARPTGVPDLLVVGIEASPHAMREHAPPGSRNDARGESYVRFLERELKPFVDHNYRTQTANAVVVGEGAGALVALYASWTASESFGGAIALGLPALEVGTASWLGSIPETRPKLWIEEQGSRDATRRSTTQLLTNLRRGAEVQVVVSNPRATRLARLAAGLRAVFSP